MSFLNMTSSNLMASVCHSNSGPQHVNSYLTGWAGNPKGNGSPFMGCGRLLKRVISCLESTSWGQCVIETRSDNMSLGWLAMGTGNSRVHAANY